MQTQKDDNDMPAIFGISAVDGVTPTRIGFNSNGGIEIDLVSTATIVDNWPRVDPNGQPVAKGVDSADPSIVRPWYVNPSTHAVLIDM